MAEAAKLMAGKRGIVFGVANNRSIAWGITKACHDQGAEIALTYQGDAIKKRVEPLAAEIGSKLVLPCDVTDDASVEAVFKALAGEGKCPYALAGSVFTRDIALGQRIAAGLRAGHISINEVIVPTAHPATPFGGRGESGWGVTKGAEGLLELTVPQAVSVVTMPGRQ